MGIKDDVGEKVTGQKNIEEESKYFFKNLFKKPAGCPIAEISKVISLFPAHIFPEMNLSLQEEISEKRITSYPFVLSKVKTPGA